MEFHIHRWIRTTKEGEVKFKTRAGNGDKSRNLFRRFQQSKRTGNFYRLLEVSHCIKHHYPFHFCHRSHCRNCDSRDNIDGEKSAKDYGGAAAQQSQLRRDHLRSVIRFSGLCCNSGPIQMELLFHSLVASKGP